MRLGFSRLALVVASLSLSTVAGACGSKGDPAAAPEGAPAEKAAADNAPAATDSPAAAKRSNEKPPTATGVELKLTIDGVESTLKLSQAEITTRGDGAAFAGFACAGIVGMVSITDFSIGDDASKKGQLFSAGVTKIDIGATRAGAAEAVRINHRRAGEDTQTQVTGTATWDEGMMSGSAEGKGASGESVKLSWTCQAGE